MMAEEEALTKWCPFVRTHVATVDGPISVNRHRWPDESTRGYRCIASQCMAWRWGDNTVCTYPDGTRQLPQAEWRGYCGLAGGKP
jgi:hypothetical protein